MRLLYLSVFLFVSTLGLLSQTYTNIAPSLGITHTYGTGIHGGGVSLADFNNDGNDDISFTSGSGSPLVFYENNGNATFSQVNLIGNLDQVKELIWVDYDNDGDQDLFITAFSGDNLLYQNNGSLQLTDVTNAAFGNFGSIPTFGAVWGDYDRDGHLDVYLCTYTGSGVQSNRLYRNNGNGTFTNLGTTTVVNNGTALTFDACFVDYNNDQWQDLYVINDRYTFSNALYENQLGTFAADPGAGADITFDAMNAGGADYDNDGDVDLYVTNTIQGNAFLQNNNGTFTDIAGPTGTISNLNCWGATFLDYDNDTDLDLYVSAIYFGNPSYINPFYVNEGDGTFSNPLAASGGLGGVDTGNSYGQAVGDLDNDGKLDIVVLEGDGYASKIWRNDETTAGNYLRLRLDGVSSNRDGIGARVEVDLGQTTLTRFRHGSMGYLSQHSRSLHFGLGNASSIDQLRIYWPSGTVDVYNNFTEINQHVFLTEGNGALPAELTDFRAVRNINTAELTWSTAKEVDTDFFSIEKSLDGSYFLPIGRKDAATNSDRDLDYNFVDFQAGDEVQYYRLKIVDLDGSINYSSIQSIPAINSKYRFSATILANPVIGNQLSFVVSSALDDQLNARVLTVNGQLVFEKSWVAQARESQENFSLGNLPPGQYFLQLTNGLETEQLKFLIQN